MAWYYDYRPAPAARAGAYRRKYGTTWWGKAFLEGRKPFRNFKDQVDDSSYREDWFKFRDAEMRAAYAEQLRWALEEE